MAFPNTLDDFTPKVDDTNDVMAIDINELQTAIEALEDKVGVDSSAVNTSHDYKLSDVSAGNRAESSANKVTSISGASTDTQYPSAKAVNAYTNLAPTDLKISTVSKGGLLRNIDKAVGDTPITSSGWIEDEKFGWYAGQSAAGWSCQFNTTVVPGEKVLEMSLTSSTGGVRVSNVNNVGGTNLLSSQLKFVIPIKPLTKYKITVPIKTVNATSAYFAIGRHTANGTRIDETSVTAGDRFSGTSDGFKLMTLTLTSDSTAHLFRIIFYAIAGAVSNMYVKVKDITLEEVVSDTTYTGKTIETVRPVLQAITSTDNIDQSDVVNNGSIAFGNAGARQKQAQSFTPTKKYLTGVVISKGDNVGTYTGDVTISIQSDNSGAPSGTILASKLLTNAVWNAMTTATDYTIDVPCILTAGTKYWIVFDSSTQAASNYPTINFDSTNSYAGHSLSEYNGSIWSAQARDAYFKTLYAKKAENFTLISNGVKTELKADKDGLLSNAIIDLDNGKYRWKMAYKNAITISNLYSYKNDNGTALTLTNGLPISAGFAIDEEVIKYNFILPAKSATISVSSNVAATRSWKIQYSFDNVTYIDLKTFTNSDTNGNFIIPLQSGNILYTKFVGVNSTCYIDTFSVEADIDTSSVPQGLFYPIGVNQFAETWKATNTVRSYVYRKAKYTNEYGVVMPAIELNSLTNGAGSALGYIPLKIDNSQETTPAITILASSGVASDTVLNTDGGYVALAVSATSGKIDYNVTITKNTYYLSSNADSSDSTQDPSHQQNVILGVRQQGLIQSLGDTKNTIADIKKGLADTKTLVQNGVLNFGVDTGTTDDYAISIKGITSYQTGMRINFKATTANTGAATLNINDLGAKTIVKAVSTALATNDILAGMFCEVIFDGTNFVLLNPRAL